MPFKLLTLTTRIRFLNVFLFALRSLAIFVVYLSLYPSIKTIDPIDMISLYLVLVFYACVALSNAMSYVALDMRTPEKCFYVDYPGHDTQFTVLYQILGTLSR